MLNLSALQGLHSVKPVDTVARYRTLADLQNTQRQGQMDDLKIQEQQRQAAQGQALHDALVKSGGDIKAALPDIAKAAPELYPHYKQIADQEDQRGIQNALTARTAQFQNAKAMEGQEAPGATVALPVAQPSSYPGQVGEFNPNTPGGTQDVDAGLPPQQISGIPQLGVPATTVRPESKQSIFRQMKAKQAGELQDKITLTRATQQAEKDFTTVNPPAVKPPVPGVDVPFSPEVEAQRIRLRPPQTAPTAAGATASDPKDIAAAIIRGEQPPVLTGLYRDAAPVRAELARQGYPLATATSDWAATQKNLSSMNSNQQLKLRQAIQFTNETLPQIETAYAEWKKQAGVSGYRILNKANLAAMKQLSGAPGSAATNLEALIADFTSELGTVYKGGNSSTDESLKLAAQNLSGNWNEQTFNDAIKRLNSSLRIRTNSMQQPPQGVSANSPYQPQGQAQPAAAPAAGPLPGFRIVQ